MSFDTILGQETAKRFIINSLEKGRISHAYLFEGPSGIGKKTFALQYARLLLEGKEPGNSPDFCMFEPDGASFKIAQIRSMCQDILVRPYGKRKVYLLDEADKMTIQAQNSLLKSLEEPPEYAVIILLCQNSSMLLPTVASRCELVRFFPLSQKQVQGYLVEIKQLSCERAHAIAAFSNGILSRALNLIESQEFSDFREKTERLIETVLAGNTVNIFSLTSFFESNKDSASEILDIITTYFRDMALIKMGCDKEFTINLDRRDFIDSVGDKFSAGQILRIIEELDNCKRRLRSNCNLAISVQAMLLNIQEVIRW